MPVTEKPHSKPAPDIEKTTKELYEKRFGNGRKTVSVVRFSQKFAKDVKSGRNSNLNPTRYDMRPLYSSFTKDNVFDPKPVSKRHASVKAQYQ